MSSTDSVRVSDARGAPVALAAAAQATPGDVLGELGTASTGLSAVEAAHRLEKFGPNALRSHGARPFTVLLRQLRNPLLILLVTAALVSLFVGERTDALIILAIIGLSVGLGFFNEFRSEQAVATLHSRLRHHTLALRDGRSVPVDVTELVAGDVVKLAVGDVVPADLRLLEADGLECDEAVLTGESLPAEKSVEKLTTPPEGLDLPNCAFMGTVVQTGVGVGVVVATGAASEFGKIAMQLGEHQEPTAFQLGLRSFSFLLVRITFALAGAILVLNLLLGRPLLETLLFALAIAVGLTPQLLPAIVTVSLSTGARRLARRSVIVKRLVSIEDLGNIEILFTDKTGTLTEGRIDFVAALDPDGSRSDAVLRAGLFCDEATLVDGKPVGGNQLDRALWAAPGAARLGGGGERVATLPFDYERRMSSVLVDVDGERRIIVKGAPELVLEHCRDQRRGAATLERQFDEGARVIAVASRPAPGATTLTTADEHDLELLGLLCFLDPPKAEAADALKQLDRLDIEVKLITGDNDRVAKKVCADLGLEVRGSLTGTQLAELSDAELTAALPKTTIFARVTPEQKSRVLRSQRALGSTVGFLGDGVNDAVALHDADVGISVESATDVARDAADIVLLAKDLGILAGGVMEGRRIFANTIKYVLMGTSSNFGNMFSAAGASLFLSYLPMLPTQILLNNLLYDFSEMTIPTDNVDEELLRRPSHWDITLIRRFMTFFGPISSLFDFVTFAVMIWGFDAHAELFRSGWFVESLATQSLVIFAIRTRRVPFFHSRPSTPLIVSTLLCVAVGVWLPFSPFASDLGFTAPPVGFMAALVVMIVAYLVLIEFGVRRFWATATAGPSVAQPRPSWERRVYRRAARWSVPRLPGGSRRRQGRGATPVRALS